MHRGKHHSWGRLNWLNRTCKKLFKIFLIAAGGGLVFILALLGLSFLITIPSEVGSFIGILASLWFIGCGLVLGFLTGYLIHLKLDSCHPLGLPE
jgi:sterol desaturase/sphingolipid hydroxylase (fatty acid hydroxylase superfamily)